MIERGQGRLRVALPWFGQALGIAAAGGRTCARAPAAEWLLARARPGTAEDLPWRQWLLAPVASAPDLLLRCPAGPAVRAAGTGGPPAGTWACARPVHLATAIEHLRLAPEDPGIGADESATLLADINHYLVGRGFRLHAQYASTDWQLQCDAPLECQGVEPEQAAGRSVRDLMPAGADGARVRSLMNELQMLLHEHPVNLRRAERGRPALNTLWLWGFGRLCELGTASLPPLHTDDAWLSGAWLLNGLRVRSLQELAAGIDVAGGHVLVAGTRPPQGSLSGNGATDALAWAEQACLAPARAALRAGAVGGVDLLLGGRAHAVERSARFRFWRRARPLVGAPA